jgi:hypothetical protein
LEDKRVDGDTVQPVTQLGDDLPVPEVTERAVGLEQVDIANRALRIHYSSQVNRTFDLEVYRKKLRYDNILIIDILVERHYGRSAA